MSDDSFQYKIYIDTTPGDSGGRDRPDETKKWWNVSFVTDWKAGSVMDVKMGHLTIRDPQQIILESNSPSRLATPGTPSRPSGQRERLLRRRTIEICNESRSKWRSILKKRTGWCASPWCTMDSSPGALCTRPFAKGGHHCSRVSRRS